MHTYASILALIEELEGDVREIERLLKRNRTAWERIESGANHPVDWGALGFTIQTLYGVLENYFLRISKYFENNLADDRWHQALVEKMALDIPGLRPALIEDSMRLRQLKELVKFRHRLRNLYGEDLDPEKTKDVQAMVTDFFEAFPAIHRRFVGRLREIADAL